MRARFHLAHMVSILTPLSAQNKQPEWEIVYSSYSAAEGMEVVDTCE